ncbi:MAG: hypothetical protein K2H06_03730 [Anaeroplasmataceae bacterium]|nr:hypothetical protein [Anaeroplasmataceae bacterium]
MDKDSYTHVHIIDYDHPLSFEEIKSRYTSYDAIDGNLTEQIQFESAYEADYKNNTLTVKTYELDVTVTNSRNVTVKWTDEISVRDFTAPVLSSEQKEITVDIATEDVETVLIHSLTIKDNWDTEINHYEIKGLETTDQGPGTYSISCSVKDSAGNISNEVLFIVHIVESFERQISLIPIFIENTILSDTEVLALFLQKNTIDTSYKSVQVKSSYFLTPTKEGIYQAEFIFDYEDGIKKIYQCKIMNTVLEEKKKDDKIIYISLGCILILAGIGIFIYRKRR